MGESVSIESGSSGPTASTSAMSARAESGTENPAISAIRRGLCPTTSVLNRPPGLTMARSLFVSSSEQTWPPRSRSASRSRWRMGLSATTDRSVEHSVPQSNDVPVRMSAAAFSTFAERST